MCSDVPAESRGRSGNVSVCEPYRHAAEELPCLTAPRTCHLQLAVALAAERRIRSLCLSFARGTRRPARKEQNLEEN
jgi:hypothetical protein